MKTSQAPVPPLKVQWTLWGALMACLAVYGMLPWAVELPPREPTRADALVLLALIGAAAVTALASIGVRRIALALPVRRGELDPATPEGSARWFRISLVTWVLSESVGVYGVVALMWVAEPALVYGFLALAAILLIHHAPRRLPAAGAGSVADLAREDVKIG